MRKLAIILLVFGVVAFSIFILVRSIDLEKQKDNPRSQSEQPSTPVITDNNKTETDETAVKNEPPDTKKPPEKISPKIEIPAKHSLQVPFTSQAPFANWDPVYEDACEEASLIMIEYYLRGEDLDSKELADKEILDLISLENSLGFGPSITMAELNRLAKIHYGRNTGRIETATISNIEKDLAAGKPVIIPANGKMLENPNFRNGGPVYHNLVITGYDSKEFITNDPGTRKGHNYRYPKDLLLDAIHDWDADDINSGAKVYLVFD